mgnify:FL=1
MKKILLFLLLPFGILLSQEKTDKSNFITKVTDYFSISESISEFGKKSVKSREPAKILITFPESGKSSYLLNVAAKLQFEKQSKSNNHNFLITSEYQKNTLTDEESDVFKWGAGYTFEKNTPLDSDADLDCKLLLFLDECRDFIAQTRSGQGSFYINFAFNMQRNNSMWKPIYYFLPTSNPIFVGNIFTYRYEPLIGFEYDNIYESHKAKPLEYNLNNVYNLSGYIYFFDELINIDANYQYRINLLNNNVNAQKYFKYFRIGLNINLLKNISDKLHLLAGIDYVDGENPWIGLQRQKFTQLSMKFKM